MCSPTEAQSKLDLDGGAFVTRKASFPGATRGQEATVLLSTFTVLVNALIQTCCGSAPVSEALLQTCLGNAQILKVTTFCKKC